MLEYNHADTRTPCLFDYGLYGVQVPPRITSAEELSSSNAGSITLYFRNVYTNSVFECVYAKGSAQVASDSITSIAIFKEVSCLDGRVDGWELER